MVSQFDPQNPSHRAWHRKLSAQAERFIPRFLGAQLGGRAKLAEICDAFLATYPDSCQEELIRPGKGKRSEWRYCISSVLASMQDRNLVTYDLKGREWCAIYTPPSVYEATPPITVSSGGGPTVSAGLPSLGKRR